MTPLSWLCVVCCALACFDRRARFLACLVFTHWAATRLGHIALGDSVYPLLLPRDVLWGAASVWFARRTPAWGPAIVALGYFNMSFAHWSYWTYLARDVYTGVEYMATLNWVFVVQLLVLGVTGGRAFYVVVRSRLPLLLGSARTLGALG